MRHTLPIAPQFYVTAPQPCPYLDGRMERKLFTALQGEHAQKLNDTLSKQGFRRSQNVLYRPSCAECSACLSARIRVADFAPSRSQLLALRHAIPAGINEQVVRNGMPKVGTDLAVPDAALDEMMDAYEAATLPHVLFGHIGDNHLHLNLLPRTAAELEEAHAFYDALAHRAIALGGTVSAEHGIGKLKRRHLAWMVGDEVIDQFRSLKRHLDPAGILGRGNVFAPAGAGRL